MNTIICWVSWGEPDWGLVWVVVVARVVVDVVVVAANSWGLPPEGASVDWMLHRSAGNSALIVGQGDC